MKPWLDKLGWLALFGLLSVLIFVLNEWRSVVEKRLSPPPAPPRKERS